MIWRRRAISSSTAKNIFWGRSIPAHRSNSHAVVPGIAPSSAWTFYGRSYRLRDPERIVEDLRAIREPGVFIVDDVAFIQDRHGYAIGAAIEKGGIKKQYYLETRGDVLLRNKDVFRYWKKLGLEYIFLGLEALDEAGLKAYRKRVPLGQNFEALEFARSLGLNVAINLIVDPDWDRARFA